LYERFGARVWWCVLILPVLGGVVVAPLPVAITIRYLGVTLGQWLTVLAFAFPAAMVMGVIGLFVSARRWRAALAWTGDGRNSERAPETWAALVGARQVITRAMLIAMTAVPGIVVAVVLIAHQPAWSVAPLLLVALTATLGLWSIVVPLSALILRPMLDDVAAHLPADFEPPRGASLQAKSLAPLPVIALLAALMEGAYANVSHVGAVRLSMALGIGITAVGIVTIIFRVATRSLIAPLDDLTAATRRVREGDLETPVPIVTTDELGQLAHSFNEMLEGLRERESLLAEKAELTSALRGSLARIVAATDAERRRVERDLHDGAQQHLVLLNLKLGLLERKAAADPELARLVADTRGDLSRALAELRDLAHGIYPATLENDGLVSALADVAERSPIPAVLDANGTGRYPREVEAAVYFCCLEALQNAAKHAGDGATARIDLAESNGRLSFAVADDGRGFDARAASSRGGLQNMADRIGALGGELRIESTSGRGTTLAGTIPVAR
jgi:signal transduction histidine kinase